MEPAFPAKGWKPHNQLDRINIISNDNKLGLVLQEKGSTNLNYTM